MFSASNHQMLQYPPPSMETTWKSNVELAQSCPRCASPNTKFCYYNNYSLSQPRYFCKGCRRYWTKGGSLRNVPVGGGCRKNRRAKSARRVYENERVPVKSFSSSDDNRNGQQTGNDEGESSTVGQSAGSDIDLAVVFAKFLNENSSSEPREIANNGVSNSSTPETDQNDGILMESQNPSNHILIEDANLLEEFPQVFDIGEKQDFPENDMNGYGLQTLLSDEIVQDVLWTDAAAASLPNCNWQPMFQLQDFDSFPGDGQLKASANLITDQWSSFDLSGFEVYSRP